ncbi:MAG: hypothetical protein K8T10_00765 [Candidatus Eremiobacteraeota bacterium]|nr:hypothetical protein [Candidatus Eremiobacteraeota bacterium]
MKRTFIVKSLFLTVLIAFILSAVPSVFAGQQDNVNYIIGKIRTKLNSSLNSSGWKSDYKMVSKNIEDLRKTLRLGGKITSNPVKAYYGVLTQMLNERKVEYKMYCDMQDRLWKNRKKAAKQAINDVGMEMISRLTSPKPGILAPIAQARTKNAAVIKKDFARLRSIDKAMKAIEGYKKSILPSIRAIRDRRHGLKPLVTQYASLTAAAFDGYYKGSFSGNASGTITFTVTGNKISGRMSGSSKGDAVRGSFTGTISDTGNIVARNTGTLTDSSSMKLGTFKFSGKLGGRISGSIGSGAWNAKNKSLVRKGSWNASKIR